MSLENESRFLVSALGALAVGLSCPFVYFLAAEAVEVPGRNSLRETLVPAALGLVYMAYCLYWLALPRRSGLRNHGPILLPALAPLLLFAGLAIYENRDAVALAVTWGGSATLGGLCGCYAAAQIRARTFTSDLTPVPASYLRRERTLLLTGAALLAVVVPLVILLVWPPLRVERLYATGFRAGAVANVLVGVAGGSLLLALLIARAAWRKVAIFSHTVTVAAIGALFLSVIWSFASGIRTQNPDLLSASRVLVACATTSLFAAGVLLIATMQRPAGRAPTAPVPSPNALRKE